MLTQVQNKLVVMGKTNWAGMWGGGGELSQLRIREKIQIYI